MDNLKDFDLDLNAVENGDNPGIEPQSVTPTTTITPYTPYTPYTVYSIVGVSNATSQLTGDPGYTESKC